MAVLCVNDHPFLTTNDQLVVVHKNLVSEASIYVRALERGATVTVASGTSLDFLNTPDTITLSDVGVVARIDIPAGTVPVPNSLDKTTKLIVTSGKVEVTIASVSEFRSYIHVDRS